MHFEKKIDYDDEDEDDSIGSPLSS